MVAKLFDTCTIDGCSRKHAARGYCDAHYRKFSRYGDPLGGIRLPTAALCGVEGCGGKRRARGLCVKHYKKHQKYGDPQQRIKAEHGEPFAFLMRQFESLSDECVLWPFSIYSSGYGSIWFNGRLTGAHRLACRLMHGEPPALRLHAAHRCGRKLCINPRHIRWATPRENERDKILHGTRRAA